MEALDSEQFAVVVAGMHRSGTSWVASLLAALGINMGEKFRAPDHSNPRGYFEDTDFVTFNKKLLSECSLKDDGGHPDWGWTESEKIDRQRFSQFVEPARALVVSHVGKGIWGWKDPRNSLLLDFWDTVLDESRFVLVYRFPWEVADSLQRTGTPIWLEHPEYMYRIWLFYNRHLLDFYRRNRQRCLLINTDALIEQTETFKRLLREKLGVLHNDQTLESLFDDNLFKKFAPFDPLIRLVAWTNPECIHLLSELDAMADIPGSMLWQMPPNASRTIRPDARLEKGESVVLSVVIPCYNLGEFLIDAIASIERNCPVGCELIIVNDGSTDERTLEILDALKQVNYFVLDQPWGGVSRARNSGIQMARGRYILHLDADDRIRPGFAETAISILDREPEIGIVYGDWQRFGLDSYYAKTSEFDLDALLKRNYVAANAIFRKQVWSDCGGYDPNLDSWADWDLWIGACKRNWCFYYLPRATHDYRIRPNSMVTKTIQPQVREEILKYFIRKHRDIYPEHLLTRTLTTEARLEQVQTALATRETELEQARASLATREAELTQTQAALAERNAELEQAHATLAAREEELHYVRNTLVERDGELAKTRQLLTHREEQLQQQRAAVLTRDTELNQARQTLQAHASIVEQLRLKGTVAARELGASRQRRLTQILERLTHRSNAWDNVGTPFQQLKDDTLLFHAKNDLDGYLLQPSINLQNVPFVYYALKINRANLAGILLAVILDFPATAGTLGIEIVSPENTIVAQTTIPLNQVNDVALARLNFPAIRDSKQGQFWLRVFVRDANVPVRIFEWRKYTWLGLGAIKTQAFCGFEFHS